MCAACVWVSVYVQALKPSGARKYPLATNPRIPWTAEEDATILRAMQTGVRKWSDVAQLLPGRNRKQCRERWYNQINPDIRKGDWTAEEDALLESLHVVYGNKWSEIAKRVEGRYENERFRTHMGRAVRGGAGVCPHAAS